MNKESRQKYMDRYRRVAGDGGFCHSMHNEPHCEKACHGPNTGIADRP